MRATEYTYTADLMQVFFLLHSATNTSPSYISSLQPTPFPPVYTLNHPLPICRHIIIKVD